MFKSYCAITSCPLDCSSENCSDGNSPILRVTFSFTLASNLETILDLMANGTGDSVNKTIEFPSRSEHGIVVKVILAIILTLTIMLTIIGNLLVIIAILKERILRGIGICLIMSLAFSDLMVACLVMPMAALVEITQEWPFGLVICEVWSYCDVFCYTVSILNLLAIAIDRYWSVSSSRYIRKRSVKMIVFMIGVAWGISILISLPLVIGKKDVHFLNRVLKQKRCLVNQDVLYQMFTTIATFFVPIAVTFILYWKIYQVALLRIHKRSDNVLTFRSNRLPYAQNLAHPTIAMSTLSSTRLAADNDVEAESSCNTSQSPVANVRRRVKGIKINLKFKRERKAAQTLTIVTGAYFICWLPFSLISLIMPFVKPWEPSWRASALLMWLGYINSMLNPIIYTKFNPDFRNAFKKLLCGRNRQRIIING